jgi:predicted transcriptional regulator
METAQNTTPAALSPVNVPQPVPDERDTLSKSEFADFIDVSRPRVSQYISARQLDGPALTDDGRIHVETALRQLRARVERQRVDAPMSRRNFSTYSQMLSDYGMDVEFAHRNSIATAWGCKRATSRDERPRAKRLAVSPKFIKLRAS